MKKNFRLLTKKTWAVVICTFVSCVFLSTAQAQTVTEFNAAGTTVEWTVPTGVTQITIEAWGAGGAGGFAGDYDRERPTGGGGGGAYAKSTVNVIPGSILNVIVGRGGENPNGTARDGENSTVKNGSTTLVSAEGGKSVDGKNNAQGAEGGQAANSIGTTTYSGGNGGDGDMGASSGAYSAGGGGGGAAGTEGDGGNGGNGEGATFLTFSQGKGGARGNAGAGDEMNSIAGDGGKGYYSIFSTGSGEDGFNYGGGGGGSTGYILDYINSNHTGGKGGDGYIRISYSLALQVSYNLNGATDPTYIPEGMINPGDPMSSVKPSNDPTRTGYTFVGWFYDNACTQAVDWSANCTQTSNFILYAKWEINDLVVTYATNGGNLIFPQNIQYGDPMSDVKPVDPTRSGYSFEGWFYDEALTNAVDWNTSCTATTDFTLYAKWESTLAATFNKVKDVTCYGGNDGKININISDGVAPYTYTLTGPVTRNNVSANSGVNAVENLAAGDYNITVKDNSGKEVPATPAQITIDQPVEMTAVTLTTNTDLCGTNITEIKMTASGETGYRYTWAVNPAVITQTSGTGHNIMTISNLDTNTTFTYSVTATNTAGCTKTATKTIAIGTAQVEITAKDNDAELCFDETTTLTANGANISSYKWSTGETTDSITTPAQAVGNKTYLVTITNISGCTATDDITITTHAAVETVSGTTLDICTGNDFSYTPTTSSTTLKYTWTIASNEGVTGYAAQSTHTAAPIAGTNLRNSSNEILTVVYEVTPWEGSCSGTPFNVTVNVKPSIENATVSFYDADVNITLYYGACDTLYYVETPTYTTDYEGTLTLSNNVPTANSGTILGRIAPGTYTIVWTLTDECGNSRNYTKNYIVNYPPCGTDLTAIDTDNNTYQTVRIGCECWTKSNLRTTTYSDGSDVAFARAYSSQAYPDTTANKANFGLLYTWYSAVNVAEGNDTAEPEVKTASGSGYPYVQGVCPEGWAIPSMAQYYNAVSTVANIDGMKSTDINKWLPEHAGTDESGFSAVGAGFYNAGLGFESLLGKTWFWSYDQNIHTAQSASIGYYCTEMLNEEQPKGMGFSVRCIKREN